jgi:hypothetical protein
MMKHIAGNGVRTIIVETASRFARDLIVQETGWRYLKDAGITLVAADNRLFCVAVALVSPQQDLAASFMFISHL